MSYTPIFSGLVGAAAKRVFVTFDGTSPLTKPFTYTNVNTTTDVITTTAPHGFTPGTVVAVTFDGGTLPAPLVAGTRYFINATGLSTVKVYATAESATAQTSAIDLTTQGNSTAKNIRTLPTIFSSQCVDYVWLTETAKVFGIAFTNATWANAFYAMSGSGKFDGAAGSYAVPIAGFYRNGAAPTVSSCMVNMCSDSGAGYALSRMSFMFAGEFAS